jgi:hypothetical protein
LKVEGNGRRVSDLTFNFNFQLFCPQLTRRACFANFPAIAP